MYYTIVIFTALLFFVLVVVYLNYSIQKITASTVYPPVANACPDFWVQDASGRCLVPNVLIPDGNSGRFVVDMTGTRTALAAKTPITHGYQPASSGSMADAIDFNNAGWGDSQGTSVCNKKKWANSYGILWDGVVNYNGVC